MEQVDQRDVTAAGPRYPPAAVGAGLGVALVVGALAGVYPAVRAARLSPTAALRTT